MDLIDKLNIFKRNNLDRQGPVVISPLLGFVGFLTGTAAVGVAQQTGVIDGIVDLANETMHYFDGIFDRKGNANFIATSH